MYFTQAAIIAAMASFAFAAPAVSANEESNVVVLRRDAGSCTAITNKGIPNCVLSTPVSVSSAAQCLSICQGDSRCKSFGTFAAYPSGTDCVTYADTVESHTCSSTPLSSSGNLYDVAGCSTVCNGKTGVSAPNCVLQVGGSVANDAACISKCKSYSGCKSVATFQQSGQGLTCFLYPDLIENHTCSSTPLSSNANLYDVAGCP
jgi:hypothetical protein